MGAGVRSIENQRNPCRVHVEHAHARLAETISGAHAAVLTDLGKKLLMDGHTGPSSPVFAERERADHDPSTLVDRTDHPPAGGLKPG
jgi:hypothetical protein